MDFICFWFRFFFGNYRGSRKMRDPEDGLDCSNRGPDCHRAAVFLAHGFSHRLADNNPDSDGGDMDFSGTFRFCRNSGGENTGKEKRIMI